VYRGRLKTGEEVAVKVQRPGVLETVTVDLYIIRKLGLMLRNFPQVCFKIKLWSTLQVVIVVRQ
jgi:aarF domain-containing kinase